MVPIGWLIIMLGIAAIIDGAHGQPFYSSLTKYLAAHGNTVQNSGA